MANRIKVGVIGTGGMGARHAKNLARLVPDVELVALMDVDQERVQALAADCGGARVFDDGLKLIEDTDVAAVVIASPDPTHADLALACLRSKKTRSLREAAGLHAWGCCFCRSCRSGPWQAADPAWLHARLRSDPS